MTRNDPILYTEMHLLSLNDFPHCTTLFLGYETLDIPAERVITPEQLGSPLRSVVTDVAGAAHSTGGHGQHLQDTDLTVV